MKTYNREEVKLIRNLDNLKLYDELMPVIREVLITGGGAESILKKSEAIAALNLVESLKSVKDDVRLKASIEILNRTGGKPVERTLNIYGDLSKMNEKEIDNQILRALEKSGAHQLVETALAPRALPKPRKPKRIKVNVKSEQTGHQEEPIEADSVREAGTSQEPKE